MRKTWIQPELHVTVGLLYEHGFQKLVCRLQKIFLRILFRQRRFLLWSV